MTEGENLAMIKNLATTNNNLCDDKGEFCYKAFLMTRGIAMAKWNPTNNTLKLYFNKFESLGKDYHAPQG